jgi:hypothetical protein
MSQRERELRCKICGAMNFPKNLIECTRPACPKLVGGCTDIENATISDLSWIKPAKKSESYNDSSAPKPDCTSIQSKNDVDSKPKTLSFGPKFAE